MSTTMIVRTYKAKPNGHISDDQAATVGQFLDEKLGPDAARRPSEVVRLAKPKTSKIHDLFEWDDQVAANEHRLEQARSLLRSIIVVTGNGEERETRAFQNVVLITNDVAERVYMPAHVVWQSPDLTAQVIAQAKRDLEAFTERFREYEELSGAIPHIEAALEALEE